MNYPKMFRKKIPVGRSIPPFFLKKFRIWPFLNYLHDSNSIFSAQGIKSEWVSGGTVHTKGIYRVDRGTYIDSALREIYGAYKAARSGSSNRDRGLADHVLKDTAITKRQPDLATRMVLEQDSLLSSGNDQQPTILQLRLDFVDQAAESITASVSVRKRSVHSEDNQTLSLRDVDPIAEDGVWAIIDDGCNCCCHDELWRQNAEGTMKVLGLHPFCCTGRRQLSTAQERAQQTESRKFPRALF